MVTPEQYKQTLGSRAEKMSEEQITNLMELNKKFSAALFNSWKKEVKAKIQENPVTEEQKIDKIKS